MTKTEKNTLILVKLEELESNSIMNIKASPD